MTINSKKDNSLNFDLSDSKTKNKFSTNISIEDDDLGNLKELKFSKEKVTPLKFKSER